VLSAHAPAGFKAAPAAVEERANRSARHLGALLSLLGGRQRAEAERARTFALLDASDEFQRNLDQSALHRAICERAMEVTGAARATFVIWDGEAGTGIVAAATDYQRVRPGVELSPLSLVARACADRQRMSFDDAEGIPDARLFWDGEGSGRILSLCIVPLMQDQHTIGALVVEGTDARHLGPDAAGTLALLATVAVPSLDASRKLRAESARASTDSLTGVANRRAFDERLAHLFASADRYGGGAALILADIDHFKKVNDTHGHDAGDVVLRQVAQTIARSVRSIDLAARYGGEEIAILLPRTGVIGARELAERLRKEIESRAIVVKGVEIRVTASFGVASYPESAQTRESLFTTADSALYEAKACGRNQVKCAREIEGGIGLVELS
jgi:diguanylate cyclase (GGDEF)-like protein